MYSQTSPVPPEAPVISYVTVDTASGNVDIFWKKSVSENVARYIIYYDTITINGVEGIRLDSVPATETNYTHINGGRTNRESFSYSISAVDTTGGYKISTRSASHCTVFNTVSYDSCDNVITLIWNRYRGWGNSISGYRINMKQGNGEYMVLTGINSSDSTFTIFDIPENTWFGFYIEAIESGDALVSVSNLITKYTYMPLPPEDFYLDRVSVTGEYTVDLQFRFDTPTEITNFAITRSNQDTSLFENVKSIKDVTTSPFTVEDSIFTLVDTLFYRIAALNSCGIIIDTSNLGSNILLLGNTLNGANTLQWNNYRDFPLGVESYEIYRLDKSGNEELIATLVNETQYNDDIRTIYGLSFTGNLIYRVKAIENGGLNASFSNYCEINVGSDIWMPNAFTPNNDGKNDTFGPKLNFLPKDYNMIIFDRFGITIFESESPDIEWDGTINGGSFVQEGLYIYHIQVTSYNGDKKGKTGYVTVFYP